MITSNNSLETLGSKISNVIYPKTSEENLNNTIGICFESNDGVPCECITTEEHTKSETRKNPCRKNRPSSLMFDGVPIVKMVDINHNWIWCPNSKHGTARCKMAIRNEHQIPPKPKLTMQQMYGHKRVYQAGQVPDKSVDVTTAFLVLELVHESDIDKMFKELSRITRKGFVFAIHHGHADSHNLRRCSKNLTWWVEKLNKYSDKIYQYYYWKDNYKWGTGPNISYSRLVCKLK